jgi:hypothetical protein
MKLNLFSVFSVAFFFALCVTNPAYCNFDEAHWSIMGPTSVTFDWRGSDNTLYYGKESGKLTFSKTASAAKPTPMDSPGSYWECPLTGLSAGTLYHYKIGDNGSEHTFRTPPAPGTSGFTIAVTSDWQEDGNDHTFNCMKQIAAIDPRFVLVLGDITGADDNGLGFVHTRFADMMVWSQDAAFIPAWGNHDGQDNTKTPSAAWMNNLKGRIAMPNSQAVPSSPAPGGEDWCWFDYGNARFITVPDWFNDPTYDEWKAGAEPVFKTAQNDPNIKWIVVLLHRPAYSTGYHSNDGTEPPATQLNYFADKYDKFVLCINGHNHVCERSIPSKTHNVLHLCDGSPYLTQKWSMPAGAFTAFRAERNGFLKITFDVDSIKGWFIAADHGEDEEAHNKNPGDVLDSWTITPRLGADANMPASKVVPAAEQIHWTIMGNTAVSFDWVGTADRIHYGTVSGNLNSTVSAKDVTVLPVKSPWVSTSSGPFREARLTDLSPNTLYYYKVGDSGKEHTFRTPPPATASDFIVIATSDLHKTGSQTTRMMNQIAARHPNIVLVVGDITGAKYTGQANVDARFNDVMAWSQDAAFMPAWGNHEWDIPEKDDLRNYKGRFDLPNSQTSPGSPEVSCCGEDWYWFDYGNTRFIAYPEPWKGAWADWNTKADAIMKSAQADPDIRFIITYGHHSAYSSRSKEPELQRYMDALGDRYGKYVLNISGHLHYYDRSFPQHGVTHIIDATTGGGLISKDDTFYTARPKPDWCAYRASHWGFVELHITNGAIYGSFICGPAGGGINDVSCEEGAIIDSFTIGKGQTATN